MYDWQVASRTKQRSPHETMRLIRRLNEWRCVFNTTELTGDTEKNRREGSVVETGFGIFCLQNTREPSGDSSGSFSPSRESLTSGGGGAMGVDRFSGEGAKNWRSDAPQAGRRIESGGRLRYVPTLQNRRL